MKKKNLKLLSLNKQKVSQLHEKIGGVAAPDNQVTGSTCSCFTCSPLACGISLLFCPPSPSEICTTECSKDCTI